MRRYRPDDLMAIGGILWIALVAFPLSAADPAAPQDATDLTALALAAKSQYQPIPEDRVKRARAGLDAATRQLATYLATSSAENQQRWKAYLNWDELSSELAKSEGPDVGKLGRIAALYYRNYGSLEHPRFAQMRGALLEYRTAAVMASDSALAEKYSARLDELAEALAIYQQQPTMELNQQIGKLVGWLESAGQAPELVTAVRERYQHPNLYAAVSQRMVSAGVGSDVNETTPVADCILGTSVVGTATMQGRTEARLIDSSHNASIQLILTGTVHSDNVGYNRGVKIFNQGVTQVEASKVIHLKADAISSEPAQACCDTDSTINCISARSCLVERIAWKKAARSKDEAEQIGSQHAQQQIAARMDEQALELLEKARKEYQEKFRKPLLRRDEFPQDMKFQTTRQWLEVVWRQANASQLAAPNKPTPIVGDNDVAVQLHESFVSNFSRAMLGGVRLTGEKLVEILENNKMAVPEKLLEDGEPWAITFASTDPVSATFANNTIRFAIRGRQFERGEQVVKNTLEMSAVYVLEKTATGAHLTRQGDVSVDFVDVQGQLSAEMIVIRTVMRQKFESLFAPEFTTTGIELPGRWNKGGMLHLQQMAADAGWLNLAWVKASASIVAPALASAH